MPIQTLNQLTTDERSSPIMIKQMKDFDEYTKKKYGYIMSIITDQSLSSNMYPAHDDEPSRTDSGEMEYIYVPYEGYEDVDGP